METKTRRPRPALEPPVAAEKTTKKKRKFFLDPADLDVRDARRLRRERPLPARRLRLHPALRLHQPPR
jgi:hypothetical protein